MKIELVNLDYDKWLIRRRRVPVKFWDTFRFEWFWDLFVKPTYEYMDIKTAPYWWPDTSAFFIDCIGDEEYIKAIFKNLTQPEKKHYNFKVVSSKIVKE